MESLAQILKVKGNAGITNENFFDLPVFMTDYQANEYGIEFDTPVPVSAHCEYCGNELRALGRRSIFKAKIIEWTDKHEPCKCEGYLLAEAIAETAKVAREEAQRLAEERIEQRKKVEQLFSQCKIGERFKSRRFNTYAISDKNKYAFHTAKRYCEKFEELSKNGIGLNLNGSYGTGKTHLAASIANELIERGIPVIFGSLTSLLGKIKDSYNGEVKQSESSIVDLYSNIDLLIIDDLGKEKMTDWVLEKMFDIINARYENNRPVVITSNYSLDELKAKLSTEKSGDVAGAITSRLSEMTKGIECKWEDYRESI